MSDEFSKPKTDDEDDKYIKDLNLNAISAFGKPNIEIKPDDSNFDDNSELKAQAEAIENIVSVQNQTAAEPKLDDIKDDTQDDTDGETQIEDETVAHRESNGETPDKSPQDQSQEVLKDSETEKNWNDPFDDTDENCAVKKYVFAVSTDYVKKIDEMNLDERSAFINEAICLKISEDKGSRKRAFKLSILKHIVVAIFTVIIGVPLMFILVNKSINLTVKSYRYTQDNFEKLYRDKLKKDAIIKRSHELLQDKK